MQTSNVEQTRTPGRWLEGLEAALVAIKVSEILKAPAGIPIPLCDQSLLYGFLWFNYP